MVKESLINQTTMSLDERFTQLRRAEPRPSMFQGIEARTQTASAKNRRLALQMARRPAVIAALNLRRGRVALTPTLRGQSFGSRRPFSSTRGFTRGIDRPMTMRRSLSTGRLSRSQSMQSLNGLRMNSVPFRGRGRGTPRGRGRSRSIGGTGMRGSFRGRSASMTRRTPISANRGGRGIPSNSATRGRGRSFRRGRGSGRGRGGIRRQPSQPPSKEVLDQELDQYMSASKTTLDKELDNYMNQSGEKWE